MSKEDRYNQKELANYTTGEASPHCFLYVDQNIASRWHILQMGSVGISRIVPQSLQSRRVLGHAEFQKNLYVRGGVLRGAPKTARYYTHKYRYYVSLRHVNVQLNCSSSLIPAVQSSAHHPLSCLLR